MRKLFSFLPEGGLPPSLPSPRGSKWFRAISPGDRFLLSWPLLAPFFFASIFRSFSVLIFRWFALQNGTPNHQEVNIFRSPVREHFFLRFPGVFLCVLAPFRDPKTCKNVGGSSKFKVFTSSAWIAFLSDFLLFFGPFSWPKRSQNPSGRHSKFWLHF